MLKRSGLTETVELYQTVPGVGQLTALHWFICPAVGRTGVDIAGGVGSLVARQREEARQ